MNSPHRIGAYEISGELARGGMGVIFTARDTRIDREVALKLMLRSDGAATRVKRFEQEAAMVARLQHPNVISIHEVGCTPEGHPWFAMELVDGESLEDKLAREGPFRSKPAAAIVETLARALAHAHERGILHRDLKPANVLMTREGRPLLTDFGLARELSEERERLTRTGQMLGTPGFMPPEQAAGLAEVGPEADVYGLGATLYAMLTGRPPFVGATLMALMAEIANHQPVPPSQISPGLDRALDAVVLKCLAKAPDHRYGSALELAEDLGRYLRGESVEARAPRLTPQRTKLLTILLGAALISLSLAVLAVASRPKAPSVQPIATPTASPTAPPTRVAAPRNFLERLDEFDGVAYQRVARAWLRDHDPHPRAREVRLRYLKQGLRSPRRAFSLKSVEQVVSLGRDQALGLRLGQRLDLRPKAETPFAPIGPFGGERRVRLLDPHRERFLILDGTAVWGHPLSGAPAATEPLFAIRRDGIRRATVSPNGDRVALALHGGGIQILRLPSWEVLRRLEAVNPIRSFAFTCEGRYLATVRSKRIEVWKVETGERLESRAIIAPPNCLAPHPTEPGIIAAGFPLSNQVVVFRMEPFAPIKEGFAPGLKITTALIRDQPAAHASRPSAIAWDPAGRWLYSSAGDPSGTRAGEIRVWDPERLEHLASVEHGRGFLSMSVTSDGEQLHTVSAAGGAFVLEVWEVGVARRRP